jgi:enoyl-[acyl-carrier protein] reductase II
MLAAEEKSEREKNRLCQLLGIRYPIIQAPMNWVSGAKLVAAVSNAGGLGTLGPNAGAKTITHDVRLTGERLRDQIKEVKRLTKNPFAVNIAIGTGELRPYAQRWVEVVLEEGIPIAIVSAGNPTDYTDTLKSAGIKVLHAVSTVTHAKKAEAVGVDAVVCEGYEGGGHKGFTELTTFVLVPMVAHAVGIPIVAGGGIADARGALAALALGADGIYMGTRFMVTRESDSHDLVKEALVRAKDACTVSIPKVMLSRDLKNLFTQKYFKMKEAGASAKELNEFASEYSQHRAIVLGDAENSEVSCGQVAGMITSVVSAEKVIQDIVEALPLALEELSHKIAAFKF